MSEHAIREYLKTIGGGGGGGSQETDPIFTASPAHGITSQDIADWNGKSDFSGDYDDLTNKPAIPSMPSDIGAQEELVSGTNIKTINGNSILGSGDLEIGGSGTSIPTADEVAEFDGDAHMNSTDMTAQDVSDFVDGLNVSGLTAVDYVVEQGTGYGGKYRKWNSGKCELWISVSANSGLNTSIWQSPIAYGDYNYSTQWNGLFNATPIVQATTNHNFIFAIIPTNITKNGLSIRFLTVTALSNSSYAYSLYVVGTWK